MISYGDPCIPSDKEVPDPVIRVCVWPVTPSDQIPDDLLFRPAVCELSGHILVNDDNLFETITEVQIVGTLREVALGGEQFEDLVKTLKFKLKQS